MKKSIKKILLIITLTLAVASGILGLSYLSFYNDSIKKYEQDNYLFKVYIIDTIKDDNMINKLKESKYIVDIFNSKEYMAELGFENRESFYLFGTIPTNIKTINGRSFDNDSDDEMICPYNFNDNEEDILKGNIFNISQYLNQELTLSGPDDNEIKVKLVGIFDSTNGFYEPDTCFASHKTIKRINELKSYYSTDEAVDNTFIQINDNNNLEKLNSEFPSLNIDSPIYSFSDEIKNLICGIFLIIYIISLFVFLNLAKNMLLNNKVQGNNKEKINKLFKLELKPTIISLIIGIIMAIIIDCLIIQNIVPNVYLFYSNEIRIKFLYVILNILVICILITAINYYIVFYKKSEEQE